MLFKKIGFIYDVVFWLRPTRFRIRYSRIKCYSINSNLEKEKRNIDIKMWMQNSLHDPVVSRGSTPLNFVRINEKLSGNIIEQEEFLQVWESRFKLGEAKCVQDIVHLKKSNSKYFQLNQLLILISTLQKLHKYDDIDRICQVYYNDLEFLKSTSNDKEFHNFLKAMIMCESKMSNYPLVESLFKVYLKYSPIESNFIILGLTSMMENKNFITAKQFFYYMLDNQEVFPIDEKCLILFLKYIGKSDDLRSMKNIFELWLKKVDKFPSHSVISLIHRNFIKFNLPTGVNYWNYLLSHPKIINSQYEHSIDFQICEVLHYISSNSNSTEHIQNVIINTLKDLKMSPNDLHNFFSQLLYHFVDQNDFNQLKFVMKLIQNNRHIEFDLKYHMIICKYFAKNGLLQNLIIYLKEMIEIYPNFTFNKIVLHQLWSCGFQAYPILQDSLKHEFNLLLTNSQYKQVFPWLTYSLKNYFPVRSTIQSGDTTMSSATLHMPFIKLLIRVEKNLQRNRLTKAKQIILDQIRLGIKPNFEFYYSLMKYCINNKYFKLIPFLNENLRSTYRYIPLKVDILSLRKELYGIMSHYIESNITHEVSKRRVAQILRTFIQNNEHRINFQDCMSLSLISSRFYQPQLSEMLINRGFGIMNHNNRREWYIYYRTALLVYIRTTNPEKFLLILKELNKNEKATLITRYWIQSVKSHIEYFKKKGLDDKMYDYMFLELDKMRIKYATIKSNGLESIADLMDMLKKWLDNEVSRTHLVLDHKQPDLKRKQKKL